MGKHDHLEPDHLSIATAGTVSIHKSSVSHKKSTVSNSVGTSSQQDDKSDHKASLKRQRRQRTDIKEEDKKVINWSFGFRKQSVINI